MQKNRRTFKLATAARCAGALAFAVVTSPAFAQVAKINRTLEVLQTALAGIALTVVTLATMWVGFKMAWQNAKWAEVANVVWGAMIVGGATGFAAMVMNA